MKKNIVLFYFFLLATPYFLFSEIESIKRLPCITRDLIVLTIPKSGSHLLCKCLLQMSANPRRGLINIPEFHRDHYYFPPHKYATPKLFDKLFPNASPSWLGAHFNFGSLVRLYSKRNPHALKIINIRDLRDVCVSTVFFIEDLLDKWLGKNATIEARLIYIIDNGEKIKNTVFDIGKEADEALKWMQDQDVLVCKFEDLVGPNGGGTVIAQEETIRNIARGLLLDLSDEEVYNIASSLWGGTKTFRKGESKSWRKYFTPRVKAAFKRKLGDQLIEMKYEKNNDW